MVAERSWSYELINLEPNRGPGRGPLFRETNSIEGLIGLVWRNELDAKSWALVEIWLSSSGSGPADGQELENIGIGVRD